MKENDNKETTNNTEEYETPPFMTLACVVPFQVCVNAQRRSWKWSMMVMMLTRMMDVCDCTL